MTRPSRERPSATRNRLDLRLLIVRPSGELPGEPDERVSPLGVSGELVEARAPRREQDDVTRHCETSCPLDGLLEVGGPVDYALPTLIFEVRSDARSGLTLAHDRTARSQTWQHRREVRLLLRATEDEHYRRVEARQGRRNRGWVGRFGIVYVRCTRVLGDDLHPVRLELVSEQPRLDVAKPNAKPLRSSGREERVLIVVHPGEVQVGHVSQVRAAQQQTPFPDGGVSLPNDEDFGTSVVLEGGTTYRAPGANEGEIPCPLSIENAELIVDIFRKRLVPIEVVRLDIQERRYLKAWALEIVELERRDLQDEKPCATHLRDASGQIPSRIAGDHVRHSRGVQDSVEHVRDGGLAVGTRDSRHAHTGSDQLQPQSDLGDNGHTPFLGGQQHGMPRSHPRAGNDARSEEHTSELQSPDHLVCRLLLEKKKNNKKKEILEQTKKIKKEDK